MKTETASQIKQDQNDRYCHLAGRFGFESERLAKLDSGRWPANDKLRASIVAEIASIEAAPVKQPSMFAANCID